MTIATSRTATATPSARAFVQIRPAQAAMLFVLLAAAAAGFLATKPLATARAVADAGEDLARLLRAMAALKALLAAGAAAALFWRLAAPVSRARFAGYAAAAAAMAAGPGVIWGMAYVRTGALLLHAGLVALAVMLWRDPAMAQRLETMMRRAR